MGPFAESSSSNKRNIMDLQRLINILGHSQVKVDGYFGNETLKAIWSSPRSASDLINEFALTREVVFPRAPRVRSKILIDNDESPERIIKFFAHLHGVNPGFALTVAIIESDLDVNAKSRTNARGLFQLTSSAVDEVVKYHPRLARANRNDWYDADWNAEVGVLYLHIIMKRYLRGNPASENLSFLADTYAAYNIGYGNFKKIRAHRYSDKKLKEALSVQAAYLNSGGPQLYLSAVESKIRSVMT